MPAYRNPTAAKVPRDEMLYLEVEADGCLQSLLRILGLVAKLGRTPLTISTERRLDAQRVLIGFETLDERDAALLLDKLEAIVTVERARFIRPTRPRHEKTPRKSAEGSE